MKLFYMLLVTTVLALAVLAALVRESDTDYLVETKPQCIRLPDSRVDPCERRERFLVCIYPVVCQFPDIVHVDLSINVEDRFRRMWQTGGSAGGIDTPQIVARGLMIPESARCVESPALVFGADRGGKASPNAETVRQDCFVDIAVSDYIVGRGPHTVPIAMGWRNWVSKSEDGYGTASYHDKVVEPIVKNLGGYEFVFVLTRPLNMAWGVWSIGDAWDVQRRHDGVIVGRHMLYPFVGGRGTVADFEYPISDLERMIREAHSKMAAEYDGRIGDDPSSPALVTDANLPNLLTQMRELGAYDHPDVTPAPAPEFMR